VRASRLPDDERARLERFRRRLPQTVDLTSIKIAPTPSFLRFDGAFPLSAKKFAKNRRGAAKKLDAVSSVR
jgi:hypothetical protein